MIPPMVQASEDKGPSETDHILADALRLLHFLDDEEHFRNLQPEERKLICISVLDEYSEEYGLHRNPGVCTTEHTMRALTAISILRDAMTLKYGEVDNIQEMYTIPTTQIFGR